ncbi:hypothetical protein [Buchnera aphidicola]|uniref:Flagellar basal body rod protein FlgB n=1 Tax=Buchnera aphidicola subsp. Tuberolachnus salignus TaxID=98804 RepID=A0A160SW04_BUCTT|nr:hypothetical protein [Buchnera aphidicola]CUR53197.1 Flagellar basal body rod protein FlgB [Buchnera aphidicola (Tuberolachnus salignus)]
MLSHLQKFFELDKIALELLIYQQKLILSNITNIQRKKYVSKNINFKKAFIEAVKQRQKDFNNSNFKIDYSKIVIEKRKNIPNSKNIKNNKNLDIERIEFLKNSILYQKLLSNIKQREHIFLNAIGVIK